MTNRRRISSALAALLAGCSTPASPTNSSTSGAESDAVGSSTSRESRYLEQTLTRGGVLALGSYVFELPAGEGETVSVDRVIAYLTGIRGDELELTVAGAPRRISRQSAWPMLCLRSPLTYGEGDLRVSLWASAPVYVIASDATHARVGPVPVVTFGRVLDRSALVAERCEGEVPSEGMAYVAAAAPGDQACVFADRDPIDESDGLPIASGAPLEELARSGEWAKVRVGAPSGAIEGWLPVSLIAEAPVGAPDWAAAALRPGRCAFPGRRAPSEPPRAWIERSDDTLPLPSIESFERVLREADTRVRACWDELPDEQKPRTPARVDVRIAVDGDGQVEQAAVVQSEGAPLALTECIAERVRRIRFPAPRTGLTLRRTYAFAAYDPDAESGAENDGL